MSIADFMDGFHATLRWCGVDHRSIRSSPTVTEIISVVSEAMAAELDEFWSAHGAAIESDPGLPGLSRNVSWQAGHDFAFLLTGRKLCSPWTRNLASGMRTSADALRLVMVERVSGALTVTRPARTR